MEKCLSVLLVLLALQATRLRAQNCDSTNTDRVPCDASTQEECVDTGCCWGVMSDQPSCFFQSPKYIVKAIVNTDRGKNVLLELSINNTSPMKIASPISPLLVEFKNETSGRLHVKISDPSNKRWEIPESLLPSPPLPTKPVTYPNYDYQLPQVGEEFFFAVFRRYYNTSLFNTSTFGLYFSEQFLTIGTHLSEGSAIYGLGERKTALNLKDKVPRTLTLWNYDIPTPEDENLYGSHPFYMEVENGEAHGAFLRNSNGMEVILTSSTLTYRVIGGILDLYIFAGSGPNDVIQQYQEVIGRPAMPPYWALGFHQCRWGYKNLQEVKDVVENYAKNRIPLEAMWTDIDYMDKYRDFTTDPNNFPTKEMKDYIDTLHLNGQHYVVIIDPGISNAQGYKPYDDGIEMNAFVLNRDGKVFIGRVWPDTTAYPDFTNPKTMDYWQKEISAFLEEVPVDGLWIDMNEPSNFCNGECKKANSSVKTLLNKPPYKIHNQGGNLPLNSKTLDMDAMHYSTPHYNVHNLYGFTESIATNRALMSVYKGKRPFVLSRSTFAGSGVYAAHWLGDNTATDEDMYFSIPGMLNFQLFGVPLVGADICGFGGTTSEELCARWMELGAFYPFSRNHNVKGSASQEPYRWSSVAAISRKVLSIRYSLLPYYYSLFFMAHHDPNDYFYYPSTGVVIRPLFFDFANDPGSLSADKQFLVGSALLITPQLELGEKGETLSVYLPPATWYDWYTLDAVTFNEGATLTVKSPLDHISIHVRGGSIVPMQEPGLTTKESRKNPYSLLVALQGGYADGYLYLDDGETFNTTDLTFIYYSCRSGGLSADVQGTKYATKANLPMLTNVTVTGLLSKPSVVALNGEPIKFTFTEGRTFKLFIPGLSINMDTAFNLIWV